jgi:vacuolar-type H+-ATPase subunit H
MEGPPVLGECMRGLRDFLERFRPAGTPGAAARPGVPADRVTEMSAELAPVFVLLGQVEDEAERIRSQGREDAERQRRQARRQAQALVADAAARAETVRADAAARARQGAEDEARRLAEDAEDEAARVYARASERMPRYVDRAMVLVWAALGEDRPG